MPLSEARRRANEKYNAKAYDEIKVRVSKDKKEVLKAHAEEQGESLNRYIKTAVAARYKDDTGQDIDL